MDDQSPLLDAEEASHLLGVRPASLYAYVSRGRLRAFPHPEDPRARLYRRDDIEALIERKRRQSRPSAAAATALDWGLPVLPTQLSAINDGALSYRGRDAVELAATASLESVAELLWNAAPVTFRGLLAHDLPTGGTPIDRAVMMLASELPSVPPLEHGARRIARAERLVRLVATGASERWLADGPLHRALAETWQAPAASDILRRTLVLIADHELNASTFAVRVSASTGASLTHALIAGLVTLAGPAHGGATGRVAAFLDEVKRIGDPEAAVEARLARGETLPGFGHRLYPGGDPRAAAVLGALQLGDSDRRLLAAGTEATGLPPALDMALVLLERHYRLPRQAALALFAIGRSVGWIAHAMEQTDSGQLIRPRAQFSG